MAYVLSHLSLKLIVFCVGTLLSVNFSDDFNSVTVARCGEHGQWNVRLSVELNFDKLSYDIYFP
jgi:hypothetical protein